MSFAKTVLMIAAGAVLWAVHFAVIYGGSALACARNLAALIPGIVVIATVAGVALAIVVIVRSFSQRERFEHWLAIGVAAFAITGMLFAAIPVLLVPACR